MTFCEFPSSKLDTSRVPAALSFVYSDKP
jgi:hypothetical protein